MSGNKLKLNDKLNDKLIDDLKGYVSDDGDDDDYESDLMKHNNDDDVGVDVKGSTKISNGYNDKIDDFDKDASFTNNKI